LFDDLPVHDAAAGSALHGQETVAEKISRNIFVKASLNTTHCFVGEPLLYTGILYSALESHSAIQTPPSLPGFVVTEMDIDNDHPQYKTIGGKTYRVFDIKKLQLLPVQEGTLSIAPMVVNNVVHYIDDNNQEHAYSGVVHSEVMHVAVKPLPATTQPAVFTGLIGLFALHATVLSQQVAVGNADTLRLEITGTGNFTDFKLPPISWPNGVDVFPPKEQLTVDENSFPVTGKKTVDIPFLVAKPGQLVLPTVSLAYFDPVKAVYTMLNSHLITIEVLPAVAAVKKPVLVVNVSKHSYAWVWISVVLLLLVVVGYIMRKRLLK
jgi:hypothetical protein